MFPIGDNIASTRFPAVVWALIAANVAVYLYQLSLSDAALARFLADYALVPRRYFDHAWADASGLSPWNALPFISNAFLHGGFFHILLNMWTLYIFGPALEERLGSLRFLALYLAAGLIASLAHAIFNASSDIPALGASGAIAGVLAAYAIAFPYALVRVLVLIVIIPIFFHVPALLFAAIWFLLQVMQGTTALLMPTHGGGIAWWAHIGGFLAGWFLLRHLDTGRHVPVRLPGAWGMPWLPFRWFR